MISAALTILLAGWILGIWFFATRIAIPRAAQYLADRHWIALPSWRRAL